MNKTTISAILVIAQTVACSAAPQPCGSSLKNAYNKIKCDIDYSSLQTANLKDVSIQDYGIPNSEKIRHLNEINSMPKEYIAVLRAKTTIMMSAGGITNIPAYANLKGVTPRGWPAGSTWDSVPGVGGVESLGLSDSNLATGTNSLAMHESGHSVTIGVGMLSHKDLRDAWAKDKALPNGAQDAYRMNYIEEYVASAVDDYYCNAGSRAMLKKEHPNAFAFMETSFIRILKESGIGKELPDTTQVPDTKPAPTTPTPTVPMTPPTETKPTIPTPTQTPTTKTPDPITDSTQTDDGKQSTNEDPEQSTQTKNGSGDAKPEVDPVLKPVKTYQMCK